jgi:hypothetical protein
MAKENSIGEIVLKSVGPMDDQSFDEPPDLPLACIPSAEHTHHLF